VRTTEYASFGLVHYEHVAAGFVLHFSFHSVGDFGSAYRLHEVEREVQSGGDAAGGEAVGVVDDAGVRYRRAVFFEVVDGGVVGDRWSTLQEAGFREEHAASADGGDGRAGVVGVPEVVGDGAVLVFGPRAGAVSVVPAAAGDEDEVGVGVVGVAFDAEAVVRGDDWFAVRIDDARVEAGVLEHLVGGDRVEFVESVVDEDRDRLDAGAVHTSSRGRDSKTPQVSVVRGITTNLTPLSVAVGMVDVVGLGLGAVVVGALVVMHFTRSASRPAPEDITEDVLARRASTVEDPGFEEPYSRSVGGGAVGGAVVAGEGEGEEEEEEETGFDPSSISEDEIEYFDVEFVKEGSTIEVANNETLLEAGEDEGWDLPYACREGQCLSCGAHITDGDAHEFIRHGNNDTLSDDEMDQGYVLTCQAYPMADFSLETSETP